MAELSEESFLEFHNQLSAIEPSIDRLDISDALAVRVKTIKPGDLKSFLRTIYSLYQMMDTKRRNALEIAGDIKEAIEREKPSNFPLNLTDVLTERIKKMLGVGGLIFSSAKAVSLILQQDKVYCGVKIVSDIRPVFADSPDVISAATVVHSLNISYHHEGAHKDFYVALTTSELAKIKEAIERAQRKAESIKEFTTAAGAKFFTE